jgi:hypothetical protein
LRLRKELLLRTIVLCT